MQARKQITGRIIAVQEQRFRLITDDGRGFLFTVAGHGDIDLTELQYLQNSATRVRVDYVGEPNVISGVAHSIRSLSDHP